MEQKTEPLSPEDLDHLERQRNWVRDHYAPADHDQYASLDGKLGLITAILQAGIIEPHETWKLQNLGISFGDALAQELGLDWVAVEDDFGRDPALKDRRSTLILFPMTMISKRIERGEAVEPHDLFAISCRDIRRMRSEYPQPTKQ